MTLTRIIRLTFLLTLISAMQLAARGQAYETTFAYNEGATPFAALVLGSDGNFYGTTKAGGVNDLGTIFRITPVGELTTLVSFNSVNGASPLAGLIAGGDGNFYGTTELGGANNQGTVFKVTPAGGLTTLASFNGGNGSKPNGELVLGTDGNFYGMTTYGGTGACGTIYKMTPAGVLTPLASFNSNIGRFPSGGLVEGNDGSFYGTAPNGGANECGTIFKVTKNGVLTVLVAFDGSNGRIPRAGLTKGSDGNFYGTTTSGGNGSTYGTIFRMTPAGALSTLVSFEPYFDSNGSSNGSFPSAELVEGSDGNFYGTTFSGGAPSTGTGDLGSNGTIFRITPDGVLTTIAQLKNIHGRGPVAALVKGADGNFYGTAPSGGGMSDRGTVYKVTPAGVLTTLTGFNSHGRKPHGGLVQKPSGIFYGTAELGGATNLGTVFKVTTAGVMTTLVSFDGYNGTKPTAGLVEGNDGYLYGTTSHGGGTGDYGSVFKVTPAGALTILVTFNYNNGSIPSAGLIAGSDGNFYGTTYEGGNGKYGTVFKVTPDGKLSTLVSFAGSNGRNPLARLLEGSDGNFYGTTNLGGQSNYGTIFKITPAGELTTLVSFNGSEGANPSAELVEGSDGNFYGTTKDTVFKVTPAGVLTTLASFNGTNGRNPLAGLVEGGDRNFYGTTSEGGENNCGTVFRVTSGGVLTTLHSFDGVAVAHPQGTPVFGSDGKLYGTAMQNAIWRLTIPMTPGSRLTPPSAITKVSATLSALVNANGEDTIVSFEYGRTPTYGSSVVASPTTVVGRGATPVSALLSGLLPNTTYYYRFTATNSNGTSSTTAASFTTPSNVLPVASDDSITPTTGELGPITYPVLNNDEDTDGDVLTIAAVTQGTFGTVTTDGARLTYTPGPGFVGRDTFTYTISDGFDTTTAQVRIQATTPFTRALLSQASEVPRAGQEGSGIPAGSVFKSFGVPAINSSGTLAYTASYASPGSATELAIFGFEPKELKSTLTARRGQTAPGTEGALFSSFKDPLLNEAGDVVFQATLSGGDTTKQNRGGLWISSFPDAGGLGLALIARTGSQPPGVPEGARWKSFVDVAFRSSSSADGQGWSLAFTGFMSTGGGGVTANSDMGLWIVSSDAAVLALREGQKLFIGETEKQIRTFAALKSLPNAAGQGGGMTSTGDVAVQVFFKDGSQAVLQLGYDKAADQLTISTVALSGDAVAEQEESAAKFGVPTQSSSGTTTAWLGSLSGKKNPAAVFERSLSESEFLKLLARKGDAAPGIDGASFSSFRSVAVADSGSALLLGKVIGKGIRSSSDEGLWWKQTSASADVTSSFQLLAREGTQPPGAPQGAKWTAFTSVALLEGPYGPLFTARIVGAKGKAGDSWGSGANDQGLWAVDSQGELQLIAREGQELTMEGSSTPKTLKSFTVLSAVPGSPAQRRSFAEDGQIVYQAFFTDGSLAVVKVQLP